MKTSQTFMLDLVKVSKAFGGHQVLKEVSLKVRRGKTLVILGISGSGKSVLMKHMIGLLRPDQGEVWVDGENLVELDAQRLLLVRRKFGMVFQQAALFDSMTVAQNVAFPLKEHSKLDAQAIAQKVAEKLRVVGLEDKGKLFPSELSGGMRKRVGLARAIVLDPDCVLYDEPTTGLDPLTTDNVDHMITQAQKDLNMTSVVISHDVGSALKVADDIAVIHEGRIVEDCSAEQIRTSEVPFVKEYLRSWFGKQ